MFHPEAESASAGSWETDPTGRHQHRWRDAAGQWTCYVSNYRTLGHGINTAVVYREVGTTDYGSNYRALGHDLYGTTSEPSMPAATENPGTAPKCEKTRMSGRHPLAAAALSALWPGLGHLGHKNRRALVFAVVTLAVVASGLAYALTRDMRGLLELSLSRSALWFLVVAALVSLLWSGAVALDAYRTAMQPRSPRGPTGPGRLGHIVALAALAVLVAAPHLYVVRLATAQLTMLSEVFAASDTHTARPTPIPAASDTGESADPPVSSIAAAATGRATLDLPIITTTLLSTPAADAGAAPPMTAADPAATTSAPDTAATSANATATAPGTIPPTPTTTAPDTGAAADGAASTSLTTNTDPAADPAATTSAPDTAATSANATASAAAAGSAVAAALATTLAVGSEHADRLTVALLGSDGGYRRTGVRTDTIIVLSINVATGDAAAFSIPRNWTRVTFPTGTAAAERWPDGYPGLANAIYGLGLSKPDAFPDVDDKAGHAIKSALAQLTGLDVHYYVLADMVGFVKIIDLFGGIELRVSESINDRIAPIAADGPNVVIDVEPGHHHFDGLTALGYVRSRAQSTDWHRMTRQRCVIEALIDQVSPLGSAGSLRDAHRDRHAACHHRHPARPAERPHSPSRPAQHFQNRHRQLHPSPIPVWERPHRPGAR